MPRSRARKPPVNRPRKIQSTTPHIARVLFDFVLERWSLAADRGWKIQYHMTPDKEVEHMIGCVHDDDRIISIFPHSNGDPIEKTGLHELIHLAFDLDGRYEHWVYSLEEWMWKHLREREKAMLRKLFVSTIRPPVPDI